MKFSIVKKLTLGSILLVLISTGLVGGLFYSKTKELLLSHALKDIAKEIGHAGSRMQSHIATQNEDILLLANTPAIQGILNSLKKSRQNQQPESTYQQWVEQLQLTFKAVLKSKPTYLKLRFIDKNGQELVVVGHDNSNNKLVTLSGEQLQNKKHRHYFQDTIKLAQGEIYLSEINLNREHSKVTEPHQEVLRSATPVYDERDNALAGILIITAEIGNELRKIQKNIQTNDSSIYITNDRGGYLLHPDSSKGYGFDLGKDYHIQDHFPYLAPLFLPENKQSNIILQPKHIDGKHVANFTKIAFDPSKPERFITVGITQLYSNIVAQVAGVLDEIIILALVLAAIVMFLAIFFAIRLSQPIQQITQIMDDYTHQRKCSVGTLLNRNDEIGMLAHSFESMTQQVEESQNNLHELNENLENQVNERTRSLEQSETRQRTILETIADAIITIDNKGLIASFNPAAESIFGYTTEEIIGQNISVLLPENEQLMHQSYIDNSPLYAPQIFHQTRDLDGRRKDGSLFPMELNVAPIQKNDEHSGFVGVLRDITDRKRAEQKLNRFKTTLDETMDCVFMFDPDSLKFFYVNTGAMEQVGYSYDELMNMTAFSIKAEFDEQGFREIIAPMLAGKQNIINFETVHQHKDGHIVPVDIFLQYVNPPGEPARFVAIVRDITERKRIDKMKNEFISTVSHELRTPLTSIRGSLGLITGGAVGDIPEQAQEMLKIAGNNTERLLLLINDILDIQKIESGQLNFKFRSLKLMPFLEQVLIDNQVYGDQFGVKFVITEGPEDIKIYADEDRLMQVMANLLSNAAKFSPENDTVEISVSQQEQDGTIRIAVTDHGKGIPEAFQAKIFKKFTQSDSSDTRQKGGTGLGLSISKAIVKKHGGNISFISDEGIGTTFYIELPVRIKNSTT